MRRFPTNPELTVMRALAAASGPISGAAIARRIDRSSEITNRHIRLLREFGFISLFGRDHGQGSAFVWTLTDVGKLVLHFAETHFIGVPGAELAKENPVDA
jgi:biotin operon repressor